LRPVQIYGRALFRLSRPKPDLRPAPQLRAQNGPWVEPARRETSMPAPGAFRFLEQTHALDRIGWDNSAIPRLWRYNQHYFDDVNADGAEDRAAWHEALIDRWVVDNPPATGTGWDPYPVSLRIVNWIKWALAGHRLSAPALQSLAVQTRWLAKRLERHLLGNHLFANAKALLFAGSFFDGDEAAAWQKIALRILERELPEQILDDGGHFELSTMYHALALEDVLDLINLSRVYPGVAPGQAQRLRDIAGPMLRWLEIMSHPDGQISFFNDAAIGIAPTPAELIGYAKRLGASEPAAARPLEHLAASGYVRAAIGPATLLADVARIGPDYLPGHAHADTLAFELSVGADRFLVNGGTSLYEPGAQRLKERGTAAHNTVVVNGENSSEVWSSFRVARRARPFGLRIEERPDACTIICAHDGYRRLPGSPVHRRTWQMDRDGLTVVDEVSGPHESADAMFLFHPSVRVEAIDDRTGRARCGAIALEWKVAEGTARLEPAEYHPRFGVSLSTQRLRIALIEKHSRVDFRWQAAG
jgi:uncharacterized heparinase superfamily protein